MSLLAGLTEEQRIEMREKAQASRLIKKEAGELLFHDWDTVDLNKWKDLASTYGVRLPQRHIPNTEWKYAKRIAKKLNVNIADYLEDCGVRSLTQLSAMNPNYSAYAEIGLLLEYYNERFGES